MRALLSLGSATVMMIRMIAITISSSIRENPRRLLLRNIRSLYCMTDYKAVPLRRRSLERWIFFTPLAKSTRPAIGIFFLFESLACSGPGIAAQHSRFLCVDSF
jgi:hypothetical protein